MVATATPLHAGTCSVGSAYECRLTRGELIDSLAAYEGERRLAFFRRAADGSIVCAACGLHMGAHPDRPAEARRVVLPSSLDGEPPYEVRTVSTWTGPESTALTISSTRGEESRGARVLTRCEAVLDALSHFLLAVGVVNVCRIWLAVFQVTTTSR
jgi:hypothetical protein